MSLNFKEYLNSLEDTYSLSNATEHSYRPYLKQLLETNDSIIVTNEPKRNYFGSPDMAVFRGNDFSRPIKIGYIETKPLGENLDKFASSEQILSYLKAIENFVLTNYLEFRWYVRGDLILKGCIGERSLKEIKIQKSQFKYVSDLLDCFIYHNPQRIESAEELAKSLARLTHMIRQIIATSFSDATVSKNLKGLFLAFENILVPMLSHQEFSDMFSQTLTYGLFAARLNYKESEETFNRHHAAANIPKTNPFLRQLFTYITATELIYEPFAPFVDDIVAILGNVDIEKFLNDLFFINGEDPIIHFYETFLTVYDPELREQRGVFYTPKPVVSFIIKAVDNILKNDFMLTEGIGDSELVDIGYLDENGITQEVKKPRVMILDPACGTGTFLYEIINMIREKFMSQGNAGKWPGYVKDSLVMRVFGFELMMVPYIIAHLKLGMEIEALDITQEKREDWRCDLQDTRLGIYLTNTLEEGIKKSDLLLGSFISEEANAASVIKRNLPIMVIVGNPPYKGISANKGKWIVGLLKGKLPDGTIVDSYYTVNGGPLGEKKLWLQDDYVKFIRFGHWRIEQTGQGVLAFVTNHGYIDNPTFRGMREKLINTFTKIYIIDLHGNANKKEHSPDGSLDENIFDIKQGVAIGIFVKEPNKAGPAKVHHIDLWGNRKSKYAWLSSKESQISNLLPFEPQSPFYLFKELANQKDCKNVWKINQIMSTYTSGIITSRDGLVIGTHDHELKRKIKIFRDLNLSDSEVKQHFRLSENSEWIVKEGRKSFLKVKNWEEYLTNIQYRPFDTRWVVYHPSIIFRPREKVMRNMLIERNNLGLITARSNKSAIMDHFYCTRKVSEAKCGESTTQSYIFPLYLFVHNLDQTYTRVPNLNSTFINILEDNIRLKFYSIGKGDLINTFGPEDVFNYIYALFFSNNYREIYKDYIKLDFPLVPIPKELTLFNSLAEIGSMLVSLHLLESPLLKKSDIRFPIPGSNKVEVKFPRYIARGETDELTCEIINEGRIYLNANNIKRNNRGQYFEGVSKEIWNFQIGGYKVLKKWLEGRKGQILTSYDIEVFEKIVMSIRQTITTIKHLDKVLKDWPF